MKRAFARVDVFTDRLFAGNPACVFPDARGLDERAMRALAREMCCSASAFVLEPTHANCTHRVRFFKPNGEELAMCGHGTIAAFAVLAARGAALGPSIMECAAGAIPVDVEIDERGVRVSMQQPPVERTPIAEGGSVAEALGLDTAAIDDALPSELATTGNAWVAIARVREVASLAACRPNAAPIRALGASRIYAFAIAGGGANPRAHARYFTLSPSDHIDEDPATGSAAGALAGWLAHHGVLAPAQRLEIEQGIECRRPSLLEAVASESGHVTVRGSAVLAFEATIDL